MRLLKTQHEVGSNGIHRSGWPYVMTAINVYADGKGILIDDFVEATFGYRNIPEVPHKEPWIGIFHHPVDVNSPVGGDATFRFEALFKKPKVLESLPQLKAAVCMCPVLYEAIKKQLGVPTLLVRHPTETRVMQWKPGNYGLWQIGFFLRNTRMMHQMPGFGGDQQYRSRSIPFLDWHKMRERLLVQKDTGHHTVIEVPQLDARGYDERLATHVACTQLYGAAANNSVIECIARTTPLLINRSKPVEYYLGKEYPLYYNNLNDAPQVGFDQQRVQAAHQYLKELDKDWLDVDVFLEQFLDFVESI